MTLKQMVDLLTEGRKVGISDTGYLYINVEGKLHVEVLHDWILEDMNRDEVIGFLFRSCNRCVIFPEEGV